MKKKIVAFTLVIAMLAICFGATLAYFTDADAETNVFTVGSVKIDLIESQYQRVVHNKTDAEIKADAETYQDEYLAVLGKDIMPGREINKAPYVVNTGNNAAYVRVRLLIPADLFNPGGLHIMTTTTAVKEGAISNPVKVGTREIDGVTYNAYNFTYTEALEPGEMTYWPAFWQFGLDTTCTQEFIAELMENGVITEDGQFNIIVEADAIQAETFATAADAFAAFDAA